MNNKSLERFIALRNEIKTELAGIDAQIVDHQSAISILDQKKKELLKVLNDEDVPAAEVIISVDSDNSSVDKLITYLRQNPGSSRQDIREHFNGDISEDEMSRLFDRSRRSGLILNRGNKRFPQWYAVEQGAPEA